MAQYKPLIFQISPVTGTNEDTQRICELMSEATMEFVAPGGFGYYRGNNPAALKDTLTEFINRNQNYPGPLAIVVNSHGQRANGHFLDTLAAVGPFWWTPDRFWNGIHFIQPNQWNIVPDPGLPFPGFFSILSPTMAMKFERVYLVFAQCYGETFAQQLRNIAHNKPANVEIVGLSVGPTWSVFHHLQPNTTISEVAQHLDFVSWIRDRFQYADESPIPAQNAPGMGAMLGLALNALDGLFNLQQIQQQANNLDAIQEQPGLQ